VSKKSPAVASGAPVSAAPIPGWSIILKNKPRRGGASLLGTCDEPAEASRPLHWQEAYPVGRPLLTSHSEKSKPVGERNSTAKKLSSLIKPFPDNQLSPHTEFLSLLHVPQKKSPAPQRGFPKVAPQPSGG